MHRGDNERSAQFNAAVGGVGRMKFGFMLPQGDARTAADLAQQAESAGWDGFFVWDAPWGVDPWVSLAAVAMVTERIRIGTMLTPVSRRRPCGPEPPCYP